MGNLTLTKAVENMMFMTRMVSKRGLYVCPLVDCNSGRPFCQKYRYVSTHKIVSYGGNDPSKLLDR